MKRRYTTLQEFLLAYFHEDWRLDANSRGDVVSEFLRSESVPKVTAVLDDLRELLAEPVTEGELHDVLIYEYSLSYDPWVDKTTTREWLEGLQREIGNGSVFRLLVEYRRRTDSGQLWVLGEGQGKTPALGQRLSVEGANDKIGTVSSIGGVVSSLPNAIGVVLDGLREDDVPVGTVLIAIGG